MRARVGIGDDSVRSQTELELGMDEGGMASRCQHFVDLLAIDAERWMPLMRRDAVRSLFALLATQPFPSSSPSSTEAYPEKQQSFTNDQLLRYSTIPSEIKPTASGSIFNPAPLFELSQGTPASLHENDETSIEGPSQVPTSQVQVQVHVLLFHSFRIPSSRSSPQSQTTAFISMRQYIVGGLPIPS